MTLVRPTRSTSVTDPLGLPPGAGGFGSEATHASMLHVRIHPHLVPGLQSPLVDLARVPSKLPHCFESPMLVPGLQSPLVDQVRVASELEHRFEHRVAGGFERNVAGGFRPVAGCPMETLV